MVDLSKYEWKAFSLESPNPNIERNIIVINPDANYIEICDIFIDNEGVKVSKYNNTYNELQILEVNNIRLKKPTMGLY